MAVSSTQLLRVIQQFRRYYDTHFSELLSRTGLSMREIHVVLFLANHPAHDTARDVTELRGLAKSQVSAAVDLLAARELLRRQPDKADRRVIHLALTDAGAALAREGQKLQSTCLDALFAGLTQSDQRGSAVEGRRHYMSRRNVDLGSGSVGKLLFSLAVPTITSQIVNMLYNLVDRVYIGHMQPVETVGKLALTGVGVCLPIIMVISAFAALMAFGGAPRASIAEGRGDLKESERIMGNSFTMLVAVSVVLTVVFLVFAEPMLRIFGASDNTIGYALNYMRIYALGTIFVQVTLGMNAYITAQGFTVVGMKTVLIGAILNTVLDPIFIFAFGMGVRGAALATILSQAVSAVWVLKFLTGSKTKWHLRREHLRPQAKVVLPALALGASPFIMQSTESLITVCFNSSLLKYGGDIAVGAMTVLSSIMQFAMMPLQGLTQGAQPIISYNYGARNPGRVRRAFQVLLMACLAYSLLLWALVQLFPQLFALMFTSDSELVSYASWALRIYMAATGIFGIQIACQQTFVALGNAKISLFLAVLRKIILLIPFIYILPNFFADKAFAVFLAEPVADFLAVCTTATMFAVHFKKSMTALEGKPGV